MMFIFILFLIACSWVVVFSVKQIINNSAHKKEYHARYEKTLEEQRFFHEFHSNPIIREHFSNHEIIEMKYSVLYNMKAYFSPEMDSLIALCKHDIHIAEQFVEIHKKYNYELPRCYDTFRRLAIIYEKRKEYDKAVEVCQQAIQIGFIDDGTKGKMYGRLAKNLRLAGILDNAEYPNHELQLIAD